MGVDSFKHLGRILDQSDKDWSEVLRPIWRSRQVWGRLGDFIRQEGADPIILEKFYRAVFQAVLLFGYETWVLKASMLQKI